MRSLINDKGGFIQILLSPVIFAVAIILILLATLVFFFGSVYLILTNYILLTGIAFIGVFFVILIQGFKGKDFSRNKSIFLIITLFVGMGFILGSGVLQTEFAGDTFVKPQFARLECAPTDAFEGKNEKWLDQQTLFKCNQNTEECRFTIDLTNKNTFPSFIRVEYFICNIDGNNCGGRLLSVNGAGILSNPKQLDQFNIPVGKSVKFTNGLYYEKIIKITQEWKPWSLYRFVGGAKFIVNSQSCRITSSERDQILKEDVVDELFRMGAEGQKWVNYVNDWVYGPATNIFNYNGKEAYCSAGAVYSIVELQVADGTIKKVDPNYVGVKSDGTTLKGLGNKISNVECCPNEPTCTEDFEYAKADSPEIEDKECFSDLQCPNAGGNIPDSQTSYIAYSCEENKCRKSEPIIVECTTSSACRNGQICDLSTTNYGQCITQTIGEFCGDKICQITETFNTCSSDCTKSGDNQIVCKFYENFVEENKEVGTGWFGIGRLVGSTDTITTTQCKTSPAWFLGAFTIIVGLFAVLLTLIFKKK